MMRQQNSKQRVSEKTILEIDKDFQNFNKSLAHDHVVFLYNAGKWFFMNKDWKNAAMKFESAFIKSLETENLADQFEIKTRLRRLILAACEANINSGDNLAVTEFLNRISGYSNPVVSIALGETGLWFYHQKDFKNAEHSLGLVYEKLIKYLTEQSEKMSFSLKKDYDSLDEYSATKQTAVYLTLASENKREAVLENLKAVLPKRVYSSLKFYIKECQENKLPAPYISPLHFYIL